MRTFSVCLLVFPVWLGLLDWRLVLVASGAAVGVSGVFVWYLLEGVVNRRKKILLYSLP